jgi:ribonuclease P protein component
MERLRKRKDFLKLREGRRASGATLTVQSLARAEGGTPRVGFTVTRKSGGSVERNRIRRRLREAVRLAAALHLRPGHDYVVIGRRSALDAPFATILNDVTTALGRVHGQRLRGAALRPRGAEEADR